MKSRLLNHKKVFGLVCLAFTAVVSNAQEVNIGQAASAPAIDGTVGTEWNEVPKYITVDPTTWTPSPDLTSFEDFYLTWSAQWDMDSIYFLFEVQDDIVTTGDLEKETPNEALTWMHDNVEVQIADANYEHQVMYRFSWDRDGENLAPSPEGFRFVTSATEAGYLIEAAISWASVEDSLGLPAVGSSITVNITAADLDLEDGWNWDQLSGHLQWPSGWSKGKLILAESASVDTEGPEAPSGLTVSDITHNSAKLTWDAVEGVDRYLVKRGSAPVGFVTETEYKASLSPETEYTFTVHAADYQNLSAASNETVFTTEVKPGPISIQIPKYTGSRADDPFLDLDAWENAEHYPVERPWTGEIENENDLRATFSAMWDETNLYVATYVVDSDPYNGGTNAWENDNIEYHFDMNNERDGTSAEDVDGEMYQGDNFQMRMILKKPEAQTGSTPAPDWTGVTQVNWDLFDETGTNVIGWYIESTFPWSTLNATGSTEVVAEEGTSIGFDVKVTDRDNDGQEVTEVQWSTVEFSANRNNSQYGELVLVENLVAGLEDALNANVMIYPNPVSDFLTVKTPDFNQLSIFSLSGRRVYTGPLQSESKIGLAGLEPGLYTLVLTGKTKSVSSKIIIRR